jgi:Kdo2-lipid IVA lauroyltransferase/acyltransferase
VFAKKIVISAVHYTVYLLVRLFVCVLQAVPLDTAHHAGRGLAWFFGDLLHIREKVVLDNISKSFPELSHAEHLAIMRQMWEHLFLLIIEIANAPRKIHETNWRDYIKLKNSEALVEQLGGERAVLIVTAHYGNFELAGFTLALLGYPTHSVARTLDNPYLDRFLNKFRNHTGQYLIPKNGGYPQMIEVIGQGGVLALLADQYAGPRGQWVDFLGRPASAHKAIALLAFEHKTPVVISYARRIDNRPLQILLEISAAVDPVSMDESLQSVAGLTQWYTNEIEKFIRTMPGQYWWLHRRWKDPRGDKRRERAAKRAQKEASLQAEQKGDSDREQAA